VAQIEEGIERCISEALEVISAAQMKDGGMQYGKMHVCNAQQKPR
jgi:hypothetical protein